MFKPVYSIQILFLTTIIELFTFYSKAEPLPVTQPLCDDFFVVGSYEPAFTSTEKRLICGYHKSEELHNDPAWEKVPFNQAKFHLTTFLQDRGYHHPRFSQNSSKKWVDVGPRTLVLSISILGIQDQIDITRKRDIIGKPLTPSLLESIETWIHEKLQNLGYPCPEVASTADPSLGHIEVSVKLGPLQNLLFVTGDAIPNLMEGTFSRYYAFQLNKPFNKSLLNITQNRVSATGFVESNHFTESCDPQGASAHHIIIPGSPRLLTLGAGIDTEGIIRGKINWKHTRMGKFGSLVEMSAIGSAREQSLGTTLNWYLLPYVSRKHISSNIQFTHQNFTPYEAGILTGQIGLGTTFDSTFLSGKWFVGPSVDFSKTIRGTGASNAKFLFLSSKLTLNSYDFEYYAADPRSGFQMSTGIDLSNSSFLSDATLQRFNLSGQYLWNFKNYDPALWIFGVRGGYQTLFASEDSVSQNLLPANYYKFLGGSPSLRGFGLQELKGEDSSPYLTSAFIGLEVRLSNTLPYNIDPFVFFDLGALGTSPLTLTSNLYSSPGIGIRWKSPVGIVIRATLAHGFGGDGDQNHFQPYLDIGGEF